MSDEVHVALTGPVARLTLNRPPLNVLTTAMLNELASAVEQYGADPAVRVLRIDAEGKAFSAGVDVGDHVGERIEPMMRALSRLFSALDRVPIPTVAVVQGAALGGGCELSLGTDLCFAGRCASFGQPEIRLGLFAPPASVLLPRIVGERRASWMLLSGEAIGAAEADRIGLVNLVCDDARLSEEADERIATLAALSGSALRQAKRALRIARGLPLLEAFAAVDRLYLEELMETADAREGLQAFTDKRPPRWTHR